MSHAYLISLKTLLKALYCNVWLIAYSFVYDCSFLSTVTAVHTKVELFCSILSWFVSECWPCRPL